MGINLWIQVSAWTLIFAAVIALVLRGLQGTARVVMLAVIFVIFFFILTTLSGRARAAAEYDISLRTITAEEVIYGSWRRLPLDAVDRYEACLRLKSRGACEGYFEEMDRTYEFHPYRRSEKGGLGL